MRQMRSEIEEAETALLRGIGYGLLITLMCCAIVVMLVVAIGFAS